ncbi:hypothetical protein [Dehalobacterium formicoaceticum]|uniref:Uncharacterized protein n=1 Tax=Dehalobacterium formicoaceticum TaxID=51515 RepID=A0ABT1Y273_9FIRM|nr:hypothetical protein [Dehalobacterium formicoaceticum]MCR6544950.1 hypothetical protein [Dehalobacterium formicoaceticum]
MKSGSKFAKVLIITGCFVFLGLNMAAQGVEKMSPEISQVIFRLTTENQIVHVSALGREYQWDSGIALSRIQMIKDQGRELYFQAKKIVFFWGKKLLNTGHNDYLEL